MFKYRSFLVDSLLKIGENLSIFPLILSLGSVSILMSFLRWTLFLRVLGYQLKVMDAVKVFFSGFATIPSFVKFSDSLRLVYMKKYKIKMVDAVSIMGMEKIVDMIMISLFFLVFVGQSTGLWLVIGLLGMGVFGLKTRKFWFGLFERFEKFRKLEEYVDAAVYNFKKFGKPSVIFWTLLVSLGGYVFQIFTLALASGVGIWKILPIYVLGRIIITTSPTPAGLGFYETGVSAALAIIIGASDALAAVILYRFVILWIPIILGQISIGLMSH